MFGWFYDMSILVGIFHTKISLAFFLFLQAIRFKVTNDDNHL